MNMHTKTFRTVIIAALMLTAVRVDVFASSMYINFFPPEFFEWLMRIAGVLGLIFSAGLGAAGLHVAFRTKIDSSMKVFARGFLGVSAVIGFGISAMLLSISWKPAEMVSHLIFTFFLAFLAIEFGIAGFLYRRVHAQSGTAGSKALAVISFIICVIVAAIAVVYLAWGFRDTLAAPMVFFVIAAGLVATAVWQARSQGMPDTAPKVFRHGLWGLGVCAAVLIGLSAITDPGEGIATPDRLLWLYAGFLLTAMLSIYLGCLYHRVAMKGKNIPARALEVVHFIIGAFIALIVFFAFLGSL